MLRNRIEEIANYAPAPPHNGIQRTRNHGASYQSWSVRAADAERSVAFTAMITLELPPDVDRPFVAIVERILNKTLELHRPEEVYVVVINNWFDHKWLEFESSRTDNDTFGWRNKLTLPRFEPSRVVSQLHYGANPTRSALYEMSASKPLHILGDQRFLNRFCSFGVFIWYSLAGPTADRASVMVYINSGGRGSAWYVSFAKGTIGRSTE